MFDLHLRLHVEASDDSEARRIANEVETALRKAGMKPVLVRLVAYWKIPSQFELVFLDAAGGALQEQAFGSIASTLGEGWTEPSAHEKFTDGRNGRFALPSIRWAHLELIERAARR